MSVTDTLLAVPCCQGGAGQYHTLHRFAAEREREEMLVHCMHIRTYKHRWTAKTQGDMLSYTALSHNTVYLSIPFSPICMPSQVRTPPTSPSFLQLIYPSLPPLSTTQPLPPVLPLLTHRHSAPPTSPSTPQPSLSPSHQSCSSPTTKPLPPAPSSPHLSLSPSHQLLPLLTCHLAPPTSSFLSSPVT